MTSVSFDRGIAPLYSQFRACMMWHLDLTRYEDVKTNAQMISHPIFSFSMPPNPYPPLTQEQINAFQAWMKKG